MSRPSDSREMSSVMPRFVVRWIMRQIDERIALRWSDLFRRFWLQSRLIFSKSTLLLVGALLAVFAWFAIGREINSEKDFFTALLFQTALLAVLLNMNLWAAEKEGRTFELMIMRVPTVGRLIWLKLGPSLTWMLLLSIPFYGAYMWFIGVPFHRAAIYAAFIVPPAVAVALTACVVSVFVVHGLATAVITAVLSLFAFLILDNTDLPYGLYYSLTINPLGGKLDHLSGWKMARVVIINRLVLAGLIVGLYMWLRNLLEKTEKWVL